MSSAKQDILERIRRATAAAPLTREADYEAILREYRRAASSTRGDIVECFIDRLNDYGSGVYRCASLEISETIARILTGKRGLLVSRGVPNGWLPEAFEFSVDNGLSYEALDRSEGALTECAVAIALTGTIVLRHGADRRALTLVPDYHLCVVHEDQIVETVSEAFARMAAFASEPLTTISGPSATADIEMTRIKGVHGPRTLDVIIAAP